MFLKLKISSMNRLKLLLKRLEYQRTLPELFWSETSGLLRKLFKLLYQILIMQRRHSSSHQDKKLKRMEMRIFVESASASMVMTSGSRSMSVDMDYVPTALLATLSQKQRMVKRLSSHTAQMKSVICLYLNIFSDTCLIKINIKDI